MPTCPVGFKCYFEIPIDPGIWLISFGVAAFLIGWFFMSKRRKDRDRSNLERQEVELQKKGIELQAKEVELQEKEVRLLDKIADELKPQRKHNLTKVELTIMANPVAVGGTFQCTLAGADSNGNPAVIDSTYKVSYSASNPSEVSFGPVGTDGSCTGTALVADAVGDQITATVTRPDGVIITSNIVGLVITAATGGNLASTVTLTIA